MNGGKNMKTDIEIAQEAVMEPITNVAAGIGIDADDLELYGKYKAKLSEEFLEKIQARPNGKLILVTAINPTPAGEGKTTTTVGLGEAFGRMGKKAPTRCRPHSRPCRSTSSGVPFYNHPGSGVPALPPVRTVRSPSCNQPFPDSLR